MVLMNLHNLQKIDFENRFFANILHLNWGQDYLIPFDTKIDLVQAQQQLLYISTT